MDITITFLTRARFVASPQIGLHVTQEWPSLVRWLTWPSYVNDKRDEGAWCPTALPGGIVKGGRGPVSLLVGDVDDVHEGALDHAAEALAPYAGVIVPTFNATAAEPRYRVVLLPSRQLADAEFPIAWMKMQAELEAAGIVMDRACRNPNRLYYSCCTRSPETWLGARILTGQPVDVDGMLRAARLDAIRQEAERERRQRAYDNARPLDHDTAIERAVAAIRSAAPGGRHDALLRRAYSLALDAVPAYRIEQALLPAFVQAAGEARQREGARAIRDAVEAARGAA